MAFQFCGNWTWNRSFFLNRVSFFHRKYERAAPSLCRNDCSRMFWTSPTLWVSQWLWLLQLPSLGSKTQPVGFWILPSTNHEVLFLRWTKLFKKYMIESCFWIVNVKSGAFQKHVITDLNCWWLSWIVSVLLECCSENADLFPFKVLIEFSVNSQEEILFSEFIHQNNLIPIIGYFEKSFVLGEVNQGQNVFFETTTTKSYWALQEFIPDSCIRSNTSFYFLDVWSVLLTHDCNTVDWRNSLGKKTIGSQFGQFSWSILCVDNAPLSNVFE